MSVPGGSDPKKGVENLTNVSVVGKAKYVTPQAGRVLITQLRRPALAGAITQPDTK